jgi:hypothetical protein
MNPKPTPDRTDCICADKAIELTSMLAVISNDQILATEPADELTAFNCLRSTPFLKPPSRISSKNKSSTRDSKTSIASGAGLEGIPVDVLRLVWSFPEARQALDCLTLSSISLAHFPT